MPDSVNASAPISRDSNPDLHELEAQLTTGSEKNQLQAAATLYEAGEDGYAVLQSFLLKRRTENVSVAPIDGRCYELLLCAETPETEIFLEAHFPQGVVSLVSDSGIDYAPLQKLLAQQNFLDADRVTLQKLCELSGPAAMKRKWVYFSEIDGFPVTDLKTINALWLVHSEGKFGFSVQRQLWLSVGKDWEALWPKIKWKAGKTWTRYPGEFIWNLSAPKGHLPLSNQLRGVQTMSVLLSHPAWTA
jgi:GUN4-like/ARM-like repeat domain, GUN4-N terminal